MQSDLWRFMWLMPYSTAGEKRKGNGQSNGVFLIIHAEKWAMGCVEELTGQNNLADWVGSLAGI